MNPSTHLPQPSTEQIQKVEAIVACVSMVAKEIDASLGDCISAGLSVVGGCCLAQSAPNQKAIIASLRRFADGLESGEINSGTRTTLASSKEFVLH